MPLYKRTQEKKMRVLHTEEVLDGLFDHSIAVKQPFAEFSLKPEEKCARITRWVCVALAERGLVL